MRWKRSQVTILRTHWGHGKSAAEIGDLIGMSRNAVIGKADRLGLKRLALSPAGRAFAVKYAIARTEERIKRAHDRLMQMGAA